MSSVIWWMGAIHLAAYSLLGTVFALTWVSWKLHSLGGYNAKMIQWHVARARWARRHENGLSEQEWKRGEPRP